MPRHGFVTCFNSAKILLNYSYMQSNTAHNARSGTAMRQVFKWTVILIAVLAFQYTDADQGDPSPLPVDIYRFKHDPADAVPNHLAYLALMQNLLSEQKEAGREATLTHIQARMSLDRENAGLFLDFVKSSYEDMVETNRMVTNRMLCSGSRPKYAIDQAYAIVDVLDDVKETNLRKHYRRALIDFNGKSEELDSWLAVIKSGSSDDKYDQQKLFEHSDATVEQVVSSACNLLASS